MQDAFFALSRYITSPAFLLPGMVVLTAATFAVCLSLI
jgi:hypothetical protein